MNQILDSNAVSLMNGSELTESKINDINRQLFTSPNSVSPSSQINCLGISTYPDDSKLLTKCQNNLRIFLKTPNPSSIYCPLLCSIKNVENSLIRLSGFMGLLKDFLIWFLNWKEECIALRSLSLPSNPTSYQCMTGFFTNEASEDCITMVSGIIQLTEYYSATRNDLSKPFFLLPRRISQDLQENHFAKIRLSLQHGRMDHKESFAACAKVNLIKEIKSHGRNMRKRNAGGALVEGSEGHDTDDVEICSEYTTNLRLEVMTIKYREFREDEPYYWTNVNGHDYLIFNIV